MQGHQMRFAKHAVSELMRVLAAHPIVLHLVALTVTLIPHVHMITRLGNLLLLII